MAVTAQLVKELRERTGAGMMECKKALVETNADLEAAVEHLRKSGLAKADKKSGRVAAEGIIMPAQNNDRAVLVEVNSETDFASKDMSFKAFAEQVAMAAMDRNEADVATLMAGDLEEARKELISRIGENIQVRRVEIIEGSEAELGVYVHGGRLAALVKVEGGNEELNRDLAMHITAFAPAYISSGQVPGEVLEKEREILSAQAEDTGKPAEIVEKMIEGRLRKQLAEMTLYGQPFVKDNDISVEQLLKKSNAKVTSYVRLMVGEGIEKEASNFADEVMQQVKGG